MPYAVDNDFFQKRAEEARGRRHRLLAELNIDASRPVILYASKLQWRKRPMDLLEAYIRLSPDGIREPLPCLLFVGDGEARQELETRVRQLGWNSVVFAGFRNQTELPAYYDLCSVFVLPSENEPWGLVVNEVMSVGRPVIVTREVGCAPDLVKDGANGFVLDAGDVEALSDRLRRITSDSSLAGRMGEESRNIISRWSFAEDRDALVHALDEVAAR
jgi:glycosyltransferase involved in cell wall biosynthesis